ncbi:MAG: hypothetical protein Q4F49_07975 [Pseudoxanthomonas suwonensis]|nr:hypothetical protein [Pseudoxanthomonas suwonensis]
MNLTSELQQLNQREANPAISILMPTHRTFPDNKQDPIQLKNLIKELEQRLPEHMDKAEAAALIEAINAEAETLDHNYNLDSLALFAGADGVHSVRFPFPVQPRAVIDHNFATRDLVRAISDKVQYLVLVLAKSEARLIEGFDARPVREFDGDVQHKRNHQFPIRNDQAFIGSDRADTPGDSAYLREFFNRVDKSLQEIQGQNERERLGVILLGDAQNVGLFKQMSDRPADIVAEVTSAADLHADPAVIIDNVQEAVQVLRKSREEQAMGHIGQARSANQLHTDLSTIYRLASEGNAARLFVQRGFIQPGVVDAENVSIEPRDASGDGVMDDVVDELIETVLANGGEVSFIDAATLGDNGTVLLQSRY